MHSIHRAAAYFLKMMYENLLRIFNRAYEIYVALKQRHYCSQWLSMHQEMSIACIMA